MKQVTINYILMTLMLFSLIMLGYIYNVAKSEGGQCQLSPLIYGVDKLSESNNADLTCICSLDKPNSDQIFVSRKNMSVIERERTSVRGVIPILDEWVVNYSSTNNQS